MPDYDFNHTHDLASQKTSSPRDSSEACFKEKAWKKLINNMGNFVIHKPCNLSNSYIIIVTVISFFFIIIGIYLFIFLKFSLARARFIEICLMC